MGWKTNELLKTKFPFRDRFESKHPRYTAYAFNSFLFHFIFLPLLLKVSLISPLFAFFPLHSIPSPLYCLSLWFIKGGIYMHNPSIHFLIFKNGNEEIYSLKLERSDFESSYCLLLWDFR